MVRTCSSNVQMRDWDPGGPEEVCLKAHPTILRTGGNFMRNSNPISNFSIVLVSIAIVVGPWMFGAWETWWFWPFAVCIFLSGGSFAFRWFDGKHLVREAGWRGSEMLKVAVLGFLVLILYAAVRMLQAEVHTTAERSFLLMLTPFVIALVLGLGASASQLRGLYKVIWVNLVVIGVYGIVNHWACGDRYVLWRAGYENYYRTQRMTGCYFCPDHFSGAMELLLCMALGALGARSVTPRWRLMAAASAVISLYAILMSQSRGGALTVIVVVLAFLGLGLCEWRPRMRWITRGGLAVAAAAALAALVLGNASVVERMRVYPWRHLERDSRYQMSAAAVRAWSETPSTRLFGIGPGMHQNLWFHYAASRDGDRATGTWPRFRNIKTHSHEVHNDWIQLLEEYGVVGFVLFLVAAFALVALLLRDYAAQARARRRADWSDGGGEDFCILLASLLIVVAIAFHSLGDFNLQIPGTNWMFAGILSIGSGLVIRRK